MIKKALEYIVEMARPGSVEIEGITYTDKPLYRVSTSHLMAAPITVNTLTSLIDYIKSKIDDMDNMIIDVQSPELVMMYSQLDENREREQLMTVKAMLPNFSFDAYQRQEEFLIGIQSKFVPTEERALLLKFAGTVEAGTVAQYGDDGITQKATVKTGLASKGEAIIPNPIKLKPYRTFLEVEQPESEFIFRMRENNGVSCGLFEADGGAWKIEAKQNIKAYLEEQLADIPGFIVIA